MLGRTSTLDASVKIHPARSAASFRANNLRCRVFLTGAQMDTSATAFRNY
jgi:hypothetical protein